MLWVVLFASALFGVPHTVCAREAGDWLRGDLAVQAPLEAGVASIVARPLSARDFPTGSTTLDGEWVFGTYMMSAMGFGQVALQHRERREREIPLMTVCLDKAISAPVRRFDAAAWGDHDPLGTLGGDRDHGSYLGYLNLALSLERLLDGGNPHAGLNDRVTAALARRLERAPTLLLESYPGAVFPVDNAAVIGSIALYDRATGADHGALIRRVLQRFRARSVDSATGLLHQTMPRGEPRGSGTALAAYFLSWADPGLARELVDAMKRELSGSVLGFGALREYPSGRAGLGDADSGPLVLGFGVSATGFALGAARAVGDGDLFSRLFPTTQLFGAPSTSDGAMHFTTGGPIGNAILLAMLTAPRVSTGNP